MLLSEAGPGPRVLVSAAPRLLGFGSRSVGVLGLKAHQLIGLNWLCVEGRGVTEAYLRLAPSALRALLSLGPSPTTPPPPSLALHFSGINGILADDMGLGKTVQIIAYLAQLLEWSIIDAPPGGALDAAKSALFSCQQDDKAKVISSGSIATLLNTSASPLFGGSGLVPCTMAEELDPLLMTEVGPHRAADDGDTLTPSSPSSADLLSQAQAATTLGARMTFVANAVAAAAAANALGAPPWGPASSGFYISPSSLKPPPTLFARGSVGPHIIVAPSTVIENWRRELKRWCSTFRVLVFAGSLAERRSLRTSIPGANVVVTAYSTLEAYDAQAALGAVKWDVAVFDEAHELKNASTQRSAHCRALRAAHRVLLTGTPVQNNVTELVNLVAFAAGDSFIASEKGTDEGPRWLGGGGCVGANSVADEGDGEGEGGGGGGWEGDAGEEAIAQRDTLVEAIEADVAKIVGGKRKRLEEGGAAGANLSGASALENILAVFVLRRTKDGVSGLDLPAKTRAVAWVDATERQQGIIDALHAATLALAAPDSALVVAIRSAIGTGTKTGTWANAADDDDNEMILAEGGGGGQSAAAAATTVSPSVLVPFIGELAGVIGDGYGSRIGAGAAASSGAPAGALGKLLTLQRKAAIHPLLIRSYFTNSACLEMARAAHSRTSPVKSLSDAAYAAQTHLPFRELIKWAKNDEALARLAVSYLCATDAELNAGVAAEKEAAGNAATWLAWAGYALPTAALGEGGKMVWLRVALAEAAARGSRIALFSQFTTVLDIVEAALAIPGLLAEGATRSARFDGSTPVADRQRIIDTFTADKSIKVMLLSTRAGGVGINLTGADTVVMFDSDWNPQNDLQAEDRVHRLGQTRPVRVFRVLTRGTIEVHLAAVAEGKRDVADSLLGLKEK